jgi:hypothetical protein
MTIMWSSVSYATYLLHYQLKYLRGNIFINNDFCATSDGIAVLIGGLIYAGFGMKLTYYFAFTCALVGGICIIITD